MAQLQPINELEAWFNKPDPWGYDQNPDDAKFGDTARAAHADGRGAVRDRQLRPAQ